MLLISVLLLPAVFCQNDLDFWNVERPPDMANIASLEVMCGKTHMEVQISFDRPFNGIIFSKGAIDQYNCIYVKGEYSGQKSIFLPHLPNCRQQYFFPVFADFFAQRSAAHISKVKGQ